MVCPEGAWCASYSCSCPGETWNLDLVRSAALQIRQLIVVQLRFHCDVCSQRVAVTNALFSNIVITLIFICTLSFLETRRSENMAPCDSSTFYLAFGRCVTICWAMKVKLTTNDFIGWSTQLKVRLLCSDRGFVRFWSPECGAVALMDPWITKQCLCLIDDAYLSLRPSRGIPPCSGLCNPVETPRRPPPGWSTIPAPPSSPSRCHCWCLERWRELLEQHVKRSDYYRQSLHFSLDPRASTYFLPWSRTVYSHRCFHCYSHASCCRFPCLVACAEWWCISRKAPGGLLKTTQWIMSESGYTVRCDA